MDELLETLREACGSARWSQGVRLSREGAVHLVENTEGLSRLRVLTRGGLISPLVELYPEDPDWSCDCGSSAEACEHVAAAAIALSRGEARPTGEDCGSGAPPPRPIAYRLRANEAGLELRRVVTGKGGDEPLEGRLTAIARGRAEGPSFQATPADLEIETILAGRPRGPLPRQVLPRLFAALSRIDDVTLDDRPLRVSPEPVLPRVVVEKGPEGFLVQARPAPGFEALLPGGSALVDGTLRPVGDPGLTAREREELAGGRLYPHAESARLFGEILPRLGKRLPVEGDRARLPRLDKSAKARIVFDLQRVATALRLRADLVYGEPPIARVAGARLLLVGERVPERDLGAEKRLVRELAATLGIAPGESVHLEGDAAISALESLETWRPGIVRPKLREAFRVSGDLIPVASSPDGGLPLDFALAGEARSGRASPETVFLAWERGDRHVRLDDGGWGRLPSTWLDTHAPLVRDLLAARDARGKLPAALAREEARLAELVDAPLPKSRRRLAGLLEDAYSQGAGPELPDGLDERLRDYQREGVRWLYRLGKAGLGALLADDMGLGKTIQAAALLEPGSLVVCPTSVLHNWIEELARFRPGLSRSLYHGSGRRLDDVDVTVTSHALLRGDLDTLCSRSWKVVVFDESQALKNPESQLARAASSLDAGARIALSGTPVENRLQELWSQMNFLNAGLLGSREHFDAHYARPIENGDEEASLRLRRRIAPFVLRRLKSEVAPELPPRTELVLRCTLDARERAVYDALRAATRREVVERLRAGGSVMEALEALLRLRQAACHAALVPGQDASSSSKLELLLERLDEVAAEGRKALVFSQWTSLLDLVEPHLSTRGIAYERLDGATRDRAGVVARFQDDGSESSLMLVSLKAGGAGLNLTAADHVFLLDPWWNPASEDQAADRAHRIGQTRPVFVYRLVAEDTVEERVLALQTEKRRLADAALAEASRAVGLRRSDLLRLLD